MDLLLKESQLKMEENKVINNNENELQSQYNQFDNQEPVHKEINVENERDNAVDFLKEELRVQTLFNSSQKNKTVAETEQHLKNIQQNKEELERLEAELDKYDKFKAEIFENDTVSKEEREILTGYLNNKYGNMDLQVQSLKNEHSQIKEGIKQEAVNLSEKIGKYKENIQSTKEQRQKEVNDAFEGNDLVVSSKGKKRKGRKKGTALAGKVIGATEETAAMNYDMQHRKKDIDKWYKKNPKIKEDDITLTGNEFELVFKNKSGSSMDIKSVMEKIALLDIKINSKDIEPEMKEKYMRRYEMLKKTLKIVCAANGIDSDTCTYLKQDTDEEKLEARKKVDYANSVYKQALEEYKKFVLIESDLLNEDVKEKVEENVEKANMNKAEKMYDKMVKSKALREDVTVFCAVADNIYKQKQEKNGVTDDIYRDSMELCNSYQQFKGEKNIFERKEEVKKEIGFLNNILDGNIKESVSYVSNILQGLKEEGVTLESAFDKEAILTNIHAYKQLAAAINIVNFLREKCTDKSEFDAMIQNNDKFIMLKSVAQMSLLKNYSEYIDKIAIFDKLGAREKKFVLSKGNKMKKTIFNASVEFDEKWKEANLEEANFEELCKFTEDKELQYTRTKIEPLYNEVVTELNEYIEGLEEQYEKLNKEKENISKANEVGNHIKNYVVSKIMEEKYFVKIATLNAMKNTEQFKSKNNLDPIYNKAAKDAIKDVKDAMAKCEQDTDIIEAIDKIMEKKKLSDEELESMFKKLEETYPKSDVVTYYKDYLAEKKVAHKKLDDLNNEREKLLWYSEKESEKNICNKKLILLYSTAEFEELLWDDYFTSYCNYQNKYHNKDLAELKSKEDSFKKPHLKKFESFKKKPETLMDTMMELSNVHTEDADKLAKFDETNKQKIYDLEEKINFDEKAAYDGFVNKLKQSKEEHTKSRVDSFVKYEEIIYDVEESIKNKKSMKYNGLTKEELISNISEKQMSIYIDQRNMVTYKTYIELQKISAEAYMDMQLNLSNYSDFNIDEFYDMKQLETLITELFTEGDSEQKLKKEEIKKQYINDIVNRVADYKSREEKLQKEITKLNKKLESAKKVRDEEINSLGEKYTDNTKKESYENRFKRNRNVFSHIGNGIKDKTINLVKGKLGLDQIDNSGVNVVSERFVEYKQKSEDLMAEKTNKDESMNYLGISYNTMAIQDFILDSDENKYQDIEMKEEDIFKLKKSEFRLSDIGSGFTTVDLKTLMYKRMKLIEWIENNKHLEKEANEGDSFFEKLKKSFKKQNEQEYDERKELLEKLNKFLILYCEANGVDFETGELICEQKHLKNEEAKNKVCTANEYLDEYLEDLKSSYINEKEEEEKEPKELLKIQKGILKEDEEKDPEASLDIELYSKELFKYEGNYMKQDVSKRTAHSYVSVKTKLAEYKAEAKASIAAAKKEKDEKKKRGNQYAGGVSFEVAAGFTTLSSEIVSKFGGKLAGMDAEVHANGQLQVGSASANGKLEMGLKSENGKFSPHVALEAGIEMALLKLEGQVGAKVMGVGIDAQLSFIAGLAAKANVTFKSWKLEIQLEASLGVGAGLKITLDFSELQEKITDLAKKLGGKASEIVLEKLCRWGFYGQRDMWYDLMLKDIDEKIQADIGLMDRKEDASILA